MILLFIMNMGILLNVLNLTEDSIPKEWIMEFGKIVIL